MDLTNIRNEINRIDDEIRVLFAQRLDCSDKVAHIKLEAGDMVYKPEREREIAKRLSNDKKYMSVNKRIVQISRKYQYEKFADNKKLDEGFMDSFDAASKKVFQDGGRLSLSLFADRMSDKGLSLNEILQIISDTCLAIEELHVSQNKVNVTFKVESDEASRREALVLSYMLYMETIKG